MVLMEKNKVTSVEYQTSDSEEELLTQSTQSIKLKLMIMIYLN